MRARTGRAPFDVAATAATWRFLSGVTVAATSFFALPVAGDWPLVAGSAWAIFLTSSMTSAADWSIFANLLFERVELLAEEHLLLVEREVLFVLLLVRPNHRLYCTSTRSGTHCT